MKNVKGRHPYIISKKFRRDKLSDKMLSEILFAEILDFVLKWGKNLKMMEKNRPKQGQN